MSTWVSTIRRARHALFLYELKGCRFVLFCWCHNPPRTPQTLSAGQGPDRTDVRTGYPAHELGHRTGRSDTSESLETGRVGPNPSGDSEVSERTGKPGNPETGPDIPTVEFSLNFFWNFKKKSRGEIRASPVPVCFRYSQALTRGQRNHYVALDRRGHPQWQSSKNLYLTSIKIHCVERERAIRQHKEHGPAARSKYFW